MPTKRGSFRLFRFAGIDVYLHWSWFLLVCIRVQMRSADYSSFWWPALLYVALFCIVTLHEFGHALACKQVGGRADQIVLWPFGGVAYVAPPRRPGATLWCIAAGPLVNVGLLPILSVAVLLAQRMGWPHTAPDAYSITTSLLAIDVGLLLFNMLPIYPLDGGQIFQSLLWFVFGYVRSLMIAATLGIAFIASLVLLAVHFEIWQYGNFSWIGIMFLLVLIWCWNGLQRARGLARLAAAPKHQGLACPACRESPPLGAIWVCGKCGQRFDVFACGAVCPNCGAQIHAVPCVACGTASPIQAFQAQV